MRLKALWLYSSLEEEEEKRLAPHVHREELERREIRLIESDCQRTKNDGLFCLLMRRWHGKKVTKKERRRRVFLLCIRAKCGIIIQKECIIFGGRVMIAGGKKLQSFLIWSCDNRARNDREERGPEERPFQGSFWPGYTLRKEANAMNVDIPKDFSFLVMSWTSIASC